LSPVTPHNDCRKSAVNQVESKALPVGQSHNHAAATRFSQRQRRRRCSAETQVLSSRKSGLVYDVSRFSAIRAIGHA
jgi:hypothetical protein